MGGPPGEDLEALYRRFGPLVYRRCLKLVGSAAEAQDCLQDTFLGYLKLNLRGEAQPLTVLLRIATFQSLDRVRRHARWFGRVARCEVREGEADDTLEAQAAAWGAQRGLVSDLERSELLQDLALLTQGEDAETLAAATLHWVEGYTLEEVASTLGVTRKTAAARLNRLTERARARAGVSP
jgi:RNA polymerase sigma-70 factor (ECF subfamily)